MTIRVTECELCYGAKFQPNSFDSNRVETRCLQHTKQGFVNSPQSSTIQIINFAMLRIDRSMKLYSDHLQNVALMKKSYRDVSLEAKASSF